MPGKIRHRLMLLSWAAAFLFMPIATLAAGPAADAVLPEDQFLELYFDEDQLVQAPTSAPKPLSQVAENVVIITAEEIEAMNAHTVAEVLDRVAGFFISFTPREAFGPSILSIHGSDSEQLAVLIDGIRWRYATDINETYQIPVQIIKRIEVIKGPASSTWGSSLGGVINIITRDTGKTAHPTGTASFSSGEHATHDLRADLAGRLGPAERLGYYLYVGSRESDGIMDGRYFRNKSFYGKTDLELNRNAVLTFTLGHTAPDNKYFHWLPWDEEDLVEECNLFYTGSLDLVLSDALSLNLLLRRYENDFTNIANTLSTGATFFNYSYNQKNTGASGRLVYSRAAHTAVLGFEYDRIEEQDIDAITPYVAPTLYDEFWGVYLNDTIRRGDFTLTPGVRYDHFSLNSARVSPSLGLTYQATPNTLLRLMVARGFRKPPVGNMQGDPWMWGTPNPDLDGEEVDSIQVGLETTAMKYFRFKTTLFLHETKGVWDYTSTYVNGGTEQRKGVELGLESMPIHDVSMVANYAYLYQQSEDSAREGYMYQANLGLRYDDPVAFRAELFGHYIWYDTLFSPDNRNGKYNEFLWDFNLRKTVVTRESCSVDLFATVHNLFNSSLYTSAKFMNAPRWAEAGVRVRY